MTEGTDTITEAPPANGAGDAGDFVVASKGNGYTSVTFRAMGSPCEVLFRLDRTERAANELAAGIRGWVARFEACYSRYRPDSLLSTINDNAGSRWVAVGPETEELFQLCDWFYWQTNAVFDPTAFPLQRLWDYQAARPGIPSPSEAERARDLVGWNMFERKPGEVRLQKPGMAIDLGGIGKEYAVDKVFELVRNAGGRDVMVNFGNDVRVVGQPPAGDVWRVGLEDPADPGRCWGGVGVRDRAVATSGDYLRFFERDGERYGHIIDHRTGAPVCHGGGAVSVLAPTCTQAGVFATTAFILGPREGNAFLESAPHVEGCITSNGQRYETSRFFLHAL